MHIREMSLEEYRNFEKKHILRNFHQTIDYALVKSEDGFDYEIIGYDDDGIKAASLILYKKIGGYYYGYAPRGFLLDYSNTILLSNFTEEIKEYFLPKKFAFIKINPEIAIGQYNFLSQRITYNNNYRILDNLKNAGYLKLANNAYFESLLPRINVIVNLDNFDEYNIKKNTRNKVRKAIRKGLILEKVDNFKLHIFYEMFKDKKDNDFYYYNTFYNVFAKNDNIDLILVKIDYKSFLINSQNAYNKELQRNNRLNNKLISHNEPNVINAKMHSDIALLTYKNDINEASKYLNNHKETYVAGAMVIKKDNRVTFQFTAFDKNYGRFAPNYFLYYALLYYYKGDYKYADLNGITADNSVNSPYRGLNRFKLGFKPSVYEYIGEFDLPIDDNAYNHLLKSGFLAKEFNKKKKL